jgi:4-hydroxybenzoate polyprenyltransferase
MPTKQPDVSPAGVGAAPGPRQAGLLVTRAAHPRQAMLTAAGLAGAAYLSGREPREVGLVALTVLVGQAVLGWHNDLADRGRDRAAGQPGKPLATGEVAPGNAWFAVACAVLLVVPLALSNGILAGTCYLVSLAIGLVGNVVWRRSAFSFVPWAAAYALYPAFLSYGGWGGGATAGSAPTTLIVVLAALLGIGVHVLRALPDLVGDNAAGYRHLPLRLALRTGATRLLALGVVWTGLVLVGLAVAALGVGLRR